jgi:hypothetical protein
MYCVWCYYCCLINTALINYAPKYMKLTNVSTPSECWLVKKKGMGVRKLVGKFHLDRMLVGKQMLVGVVYVGRESNCRANKLLVGKEMSVGKGLCRPDLQWPTFSVGKTLSRPTFRRWKLLFRPTCLLGIKCCGIVTGNISRWPKLSKTEMTGPSKPNRPNARAEPYRARGCTRPTLRDLHLGKP